MKIIVFLILASLSSVTQAQVKKHDRSDVRLVLAFGQSNIGEGFGTNFNKLQPHPADKDTLYSVSMQSGPKKLTWGNIRGAGGGRCGALVHFLRDRYDKGETNWCGVSYSRGGYSLEKHWLKGLELEDVHFRAIKDSFGEVLGYSKGHSKPINLDLIYFHQGESDMSSKAMAQKWHSNFESLKKRMNKYGITWDKMIIAQPSGAYLKRPGGKVVSSSIAIAANMDGKTELLTTDDIPYDKTNHFDNEGQKAIAVKLSKLWDSTKK